MSTQLEVKPINLETNSDLVHWSCCIETPEPRYLSLCGLDLSDQNEASPETEVDCVVCVDMSKHGKCPRFGVCLGGLRDGVIR